MPAAWIVTVVPLSAPGNDEGLGLPPATVIVKFAAPAVPPLSLTTCLITIRCASVGRAALTAMVPVEVLLPVKFGPSFAPVTVAVLVMLGWLARVLMPAILTEMDVLNSTLVLEGSVRIC